MTIDGLFLFNQKEFELGLEIKKSPDEIVWNGGFLRVAGQNRLNYKYHLSVRADDYLKKNSNPSSINSVDWEGFFLSNKDGLENNSSIDLVVTFSVSKKICTITRDTFGLIPVYYFHLPDGFLAFSTSLPSLLRIDGVLDHLSINAKRIIQYLTYRADSRVDYATETFFEQINSVLPAHRIVATSSSISTKPCVNFNPGQWSHLTTLSEFADVFKSLFHNSVANSVNGDIIGAHLSGGMDSSSISSVAKKLFPSKEFHTFHGAPNTQFASENEYAQAVADQIGSIHHEIAPKHNDFDFLAKYTAIHGHPEVMIVSPALQGSLLEAAHAHGCNTLLMGHDGDSVVGSGFDYLTELFDKRQWAELKEFLASRTQNPSFLRLFKNWNTLSEGKKLQAVYHDFFGRRFLEVAATSSITEQFTLFAEVKKNFDISTFHFLKRGFTSTIRRFRDKKIPNSLVKKSARDLILAKSKSNKTLSESLSENLEKRFNYSFSSVYSAQSITMNEEFFALGNHYNMQASLPFFSKELFELCMSVPSKLKLGDGIGREHFREAMRDILPEKVRTRRDKSVFGSYGFLAARRLFRDADGLLRNEENQVWDFIDKDEFNKIVKILHDNNQKPLIYTISQFHILRTISLAVWFDWLESLKSEGKAKKEL